MPLLRQVIARTGETIDMALIMRRCAWQVYFKSRSRGCRFGGGRRPVNRGDDMSRRCAPADTHTTYYIASRTAALISILGRGRAALDDVAGLCFRHRRTRPSYK